MFSLCCGLLIGVPAYLARPLRRAPKVTIFVGLITLVPILRLIGPALPV